MRVITAIFLFTLICASTVYADCSSSDGKGAWEASTADGYSIDEIATTSGGRVNVLVASQGYRISVSGAYGTTLDLNVDSEGLDAFVFTPENVSTCREITYIVDGNTLKKAQVYTASDKVLGLEDPLQFLLALLGGNTVTVNYHNLWDTTRTMTFSITGVENAIEPWIGVHKQTARKVRGYTKKLKRKRQRDCKNNRSLDYYME